MVNLQTGIGTTRGYWQYLTTGWKYVLPHGSGHVRRAASFIHSERIDLALFCEIEGGSRRTRGVDQVELIAEETPLKETAFFPTLVVGQRINQGNAVCSRFPIRLVHNHPLPGTGEPRFLSEAELTIVDTTVRVFITHLSLEVRARKAQIDHLVEIVNREDSPAILGGDFNVSSRQELQLLEESELAMATAAATFPSWNPKRDLDYLFFTRHFSLRQSLTFDRFLFSDHRPFIAEVLFEP